MDVDSLPQFPLAPPLPPVPDLYNIPKAELETLIAEVVREEGFLKLVSRQNTTLLKGR